MAYLPPSKLSAKTALMEDAAASAGRDPRTIRRIYNVGGLITDTVDEREDALVGPVAYWADRLLGLAQSHALDTFILWPAGDVDAQLELFAAQVAPLVRAGA